MALAILRYEDSNSTHCRFRIDLGTTNRFYTYAIGNSQVVRRNGLPFLVKPKFVSPLLSLPEYRLGRDVLEVPHEQFDDHHRFVQLISYRTPDKIGPALSDIVMVPIIANPDKPLSIPFSSETTVMDNQPVYTVSFSYDEAPYSESQSFLGKLLKGATKAVSGLVKGVVKAVPVVSKLAGSLLPQLLPVLSPVLGKTGASLVGQLAGVLGSGKSLTGVLKDPSKVAQIGKILQQSGVTPSGLAPISEPIQAMSLTLATPSTAASGSSYSDAQFLTRHYGFSPLTKPNGSGSNGSMTIAPAFPESSGWPEWDEPNGQVNHKSLLLKLLNHSLHPETVQGIMAGPMRHEMLQGMVTHGLIDTLKVIPGFHKALERVITEEARQNGHPPAIAGLASRSPEHPYHRVEAVTLHFTDIEPQIIGGRSRVLYHIEDDIAFPLELDTPRPISQGTLQILVKCPKTLEVLVDKKIHLGHLNSGDLDTVPHLRRSQLRSLEPNEEYLICAVLTWTAESSYSGQKRRLGTSTSLLVTLVGDYIFDRLEGVEETISLNDPQEYRPYWHKVWEEDFSADGQHIALDCKYYYILEPEERNNARMETLIRMDEGGRTNLSSKLKTGMVLSPTRLERLTSWISDKPRLDEEEMAALNCCEFRDRFHQLARTQVEFEGDEGDSATLWVYPEVDLRQVILKQVMDRDANGRVLELAERTVYFPLPTTAHFVGTATT